MAHHLLKAAFTGLVTSEKEHSEASLASVFYGAFAIQQSQSDWSTEPLSIGNRENSVVVQPLTSVDTIWKGDEWSCIPVKIKLHSSFLNLCDQAKRSDLFLTATAESARSGTLLQHGDDKVRVVFKNEFDDSDPFAERSSGDIRPYNKVWLYVHKSCFAADEFFFVRVDVTSASSSPIPKDLSLFGRTEPIRVARYSLSLKQHFMRNRHTIHLVDDFYAWFAKSGGGTLGLEAEVVMLDEDGSTVEHYACKVPLKTALIYSDGIPAPERMVNAKAHSKGKGKGKGTFLASSSHDAAKKLQLFNDLTANHSLGPEKLSQNLSFRIEEVSFHHAAHAGFKIKVSLANSGQMNVRAAILNETIVVLSKPKTRLDGMARDPTVRKTTKDVPTKISLAPKAVPGKSVKVSKEPSGKTAVTENTSKKRKNAPGTDLSPEGSLLSTSGHAPKTANGTYPSPDSGLVTDIGHASKAWSGKSANASKEPSRKTTSIQTSSKRRNTAPGTDPSPDGGLVSDSGHAPRSEMTQAYLHIEQGGDLALLAENTDTTSETDSNSTSLPIRLVPSDQNIFRRPPLVRYQALFSPVRPLSPSQTLHMFATRVSSQDSDKFPDLTFSLSDSEDTGNIDYTMSFPGAIMSVTDLDYECWTGKSLLESPQPSNILPVLDLDDHVKYI